MNLIIKPLVTEKSMNTVGNNKYTFIVARFAKKKEIKKAIEKFFKVNVIAISTILIKGKSHRVGARRIEKKLTPFKKAVIQIKKGEKIGLFEAGQ